LIHGPLLDQLVPKTAFRFGPYHPDVIALPPVAVKVVLTAAILAAVMAGLLRMPSRTFDGRIVVAIVASTFAFVETVTYAHFKVDGSHTWSYPIPFGGTFNYMNVPPSVMRPPGEEKLKAFAETLQVEDFRSALLSLPSFYPGVATSHISQFWQARMIGGYATGVPKRVAELPWPDGVRGVRTIDLRSMSDINPALLSLLNVKYLVVLTADLYFDTASQNSDKSRRILPLGIPSHEGEVVEIDGISFGLIRNSVAPLPRHFLVEKVTGVEGTPSMEGAALQARPARERPGAAGAATLVRERIDELTSHSLAEDFHGAQVFDGSGPLVVTYRADAVDIRVTPSNRDRFVVINELYHPNWRARAGAQDTPIFPTNAVMMGIRIPSNLDRIELRFEPFSSSRPAHMLMLLALLIFLAAIGALWLESRRMSRQSL
jgi:hypothetical protein